LGTPHVIYLDSQLTPETLTNPYFGGWFIGGNFPKSRFSSPLVTSGRD